MRNLKISKNPIEFMSNFMKLESSSGYLLIAAMVLALSVANIPTAQTVYEWILGLHLTVTIGGLGVDKPLLLWVNDALMVFFFMLVGLELKREVVEGQLSKPDQVALPILAAVGGLVLPAAIYWFINGDIADQRNGWAIPTATDIAFALAMLGLLGSRAPVALKVFLTTIAIVDDIAAIVIIAIFYTSDLSLFESGPGGAGRRCSFRAEPFESDAAGPVYAGRPVHLAVRPQIRSARHARRCRGCPVYSTDSGRQ